MYSKCLFGILAAAAMFSGVNGATCSKPPAKTGYKTPSADPSSLDTTNAIWGNAGGTIASGTASFVAVCADGYSGTVVATKCAADGIYTLSGCTATVATDCIDAEIFCPGTKTCVANDCNACTGTTTSPVAGDISAAGDTCVEQATDCANA